MFLKPRLPEIPATPLFRAELGAWPEAACLGRMCIGTDGAGSSETGMLHVTTWGWVLLDSNYDIVKAAYGSMPSPMTVPRAEIIAEKNL